MLEEEEKRIDDKEDEENFFKQHKKCEKGKGRKIVYGECFISALTIKKKCL
jgi:hypothetical protein